MSIITEFKTSQNEIKNDAFQKLFRLFVILFSYQYVPDPIKRKKTQTTEANSYKMSIPKIPNISKFSLIFFVSY